MRLPSVLREMFAPDPYGPKGRQIRIENATESMTRLLMEQADKQGWDKSGISVSRDDEAKTIYCMDVIRGEALAKKEVKDLERILKSKGENAWKVSSIEGSWLSELEGAYDPDNPFHSHIVPWMQSYLAALPQRARTAPDAVFRIAIIPILDAVPSVFPKDLPQRMMEGQQWWNEEQLACVNTLNAKIAPHEQVNAVFPTPITSNVVFQVVLAAQSYEQEFMGK